jgi:hypothetical protein
MADARNGSKAIPNNHLEGYRSANLTKQIATCVKAEVDNDFSKILYLVGLADVAI